MKLKRHPHRHHIAFTLIEVTMALGILFMAVFAILGVISNGLRNARGMQKKGPDAGMIAAYVSSISASNALKEEVNSGDFGDMYPNYMWDYEPRETMTNKLYQVDIAIHSRSGNERDNSTLSILLFSPNSPPGSMDGGVGAGGGLRR